MTSTERTIAATWKMMRDTLSLRGYVPKDGDGSTAGIAACADDLAQITQTEATRHRESNEALSVVSSALSLLATSARMYLKTRGADAAAADSAVQLARDLFTTNVRDVPPLSGGRGGGAPR